METENSDHDFWSIESGITTHLNKINRNSNVQTLYSKCAKNCKNLSEESYLIIAYTRQVELRIFRKIIPYFIFNYNDSYSICHYTFNEPYMREGNDLHPEVLNLSCVDDPSYFNINHIRIELKNGGLNLHEKILE